MNTSACVKAIIANVGIKQGDLAGVLGLSSVQAVSNKFRLNRWSAEDLIKIAQLTGCELCFCLPSGERITLSGSPATTPPSGDMPGPGRGE